MNRIIVIFVLVLTVQSNCEVSKRVVVRGRILNRLNLEFITLVRNDEKKYLFVSEPRIIVSSLVLHSGEDVLFGFGFSMDEGSSFFKVGIANKSEVFTSADTSRFKCVRQSISSSSYLFQKDENFNDLVKKVEVTVFFDYFVMGDDNIKKFRQDYVCESFKENGEFLLNKKEKVPGKSKGVSP